MCCACRPAIFVNVFKNRPRDLSVKATSVGSGAAPARHRRSAAFALTRPVYFARGEYAELREIAGEDRTSLEASICDCADFIGFRPVEAGADHTRHSIRSIAIPLVRNAYDHFYQLDYAGAVSRFEQFHSQHTGDPQATALLLNAVLFQELYRMDLLDTSFYSNDGFASGKRPNNPDPKVRERIFALTDEAVHEADWRLGQNPKDIDALYARGWARSLAKVYLRCALVERGFASGLRLSIQARRRSSARSSSSTPNMRDAKLVFGIYWYVVGSLPLPLRTVVSAVGFQRLQSQGYADAPGRSQSRLYHLS